MATFTLTVTLEAADNNKPMPLDEIMEAIKYAVMDEHGQSDHEYRGVAVGDDGESEEFSKVKSIDVVEVED